MKRITICARVTGPLLMPDNRTGKCRDCQSTVQFRPYAPKGPKLCMQCAADLPIGEVEVANDKTQRRMIKDAKDYFQKQKH